MANLCSNSKCLNVVLDEERTCVMCGGYLCWDHVVRVAITVHVLGVAYEIPAYLCRMCAQKHIGQILLEKRKLNDDTVLESLIGNMIEAVYNGS